MGVPLHEYEVPPTTLAMQGHKGGPHILKRIVSVIPLMQNNYVMSVLAGYVGFIVSVTFEFIPTTSDLCSIWKSMPSNVLAILKVIS